LTVSRLTKRGVTVEELDPVAEYRISPMLNALLLKVLRMEQSLIRGGFDLPIGGSRLLVAQKR
jgi:hypothetical protein